MGLLWWGPTGALPWQPSGEKRVVPWATKALFGVLGLRALGGFLPVWLFGVALGSVTLASFLASLVPVTKGVIGLGGNGRWSPKIEHLEPKMKLKLRSYI